MWLFTKYGFFSAVCDTCLVPNAKGKGYRPAPNPDTILIRARVRAHLTNLIEAVPCLRGQEIVETRNRDYRFRIRVPAVTMPRVMTSLAKDIDYSNFKNEVASREGASSYEKALHRVWSVMYGVQREEHGPGIYDGPPTEGIDFDTEDDGTEGPGGTATAVLDDEDDREDPSGTTPGPLR